MRTTYVFKVDSQVRKRGRRNSPQKLRLVLSKNFSKVPRSYRAKRQCNPSVKRYNQQLTTKYKTCTGKTQTYVRRCGTSSTQIRQPPTIIARSTHQCQKGRINTQHSELLDCRPFVAATWPADMMCTNNAVCIGGRSETTCANCSTTTGGIYHVAPANSQRTRRESARFARMRATVYERRHRNVVQGRPHPADSCSDGDVIYLGCQSRYVKRRKRGRSWGFVVVCYALKIIKKNSYVYF